MFVVEVTTNFGGVFGVVYGGVFGVVLGNTPPRSNLDKHWLRSKFGGVLGEKRKRACKMFAVSKVIVTLRLTTS